VVYVKGVLKSRKRGKPTFDDKLLKHWEKLRVLDFFNENEVAEYEKEGIQLIERMKRKSDEKGKIKKLFLDIMGETKQAFCSGSQESDHLQEHDSTKKTLTKIIKESNLDRNKSTSSEAYKKLRNFYFGDKKTKLH